MKKFFKALTIWLVILSTLTFLISCDNKSSNKNGGNSKPFLVHYIDVGQGDSILVQCNNKNLLIDAGPKEGENSLVKYLKNKDIKTLDYVISTHPHEDHIGGIAKVIKTFDVKKFYSPKVSTSTKTYENTINALKSKNLKINIIKKGIDNDITLGDDVTISIFSPNLDKYDNLNNYSPIIKISYKNNSFLFTGDAEKKVENEVLKNKENLKADVLKVGHHGSSSSTSLEFLKKVNPSIAVISCSANNDYGHPHKETLDKLNKLNNIKIYRTDKDSNVVLASDGNNISILKNK